MGYMEKNSANTAYVPPSVADAGRRDRMYFREISSSDVRWIYEAMDEVLDPMEYEGSLLFDEYPDAGEISRLTDQVLRRAGKRKSGQEFDDPMQARELAKALLCEEMCRRRFRHLMRRAEMSGQNG